MKEVNDVVHQSLRQVDLELVGELDNFGSEVDADRKRRSVKEAADHLHRKN